MSKGKISVNKRISKAKISTGKLGANNQNYFFTSESVSEGHPDKICDQVSDAVLDAMLKDDPESRVAVECFAATGMILVGGEVRTNTYCELSDIARDVIRNIGYTKGEYRFDADSISVLNIINRQSADIAKGVDKGGAGDQGMMFGYAINETKELMPAPIMYAHRLVKRLADIRKKTPNLMPYLRPDAKSQVTFEYDSTGKIIRCDAIVISQQHDPGISQKKIREDIIENVIKYVFPENYLDKNTKYHINPTGIFVIGGPHGDTGLTGRKIIVDTYGGRAPHGGGAFSGKDPTKVDRSGAYAARHIAKNIVASGLAKECTLQISYAIGVREPVSIFVNTHHTSEIDDSEIANFIKKNIDLTPGGIIKRLDLKRPIYSKTAAYGHYGKPNLPWEQLNLIELFKKI
ncbi:methionine adenosyltransferase [Bacteroidetes/Chlorobi group bacterium ChocPot_Mid]|jgi:S-adenosylmethionine synthetase|nr:MAG: methionine adenosyltransferase [Bacteroidetes/Chlorobi group bacterium ChocPot_Mid]